uniref:Asparaginase and isoaspartyl peptidase 1 n=1 Tax=Piliocolobus tephrosceles TaxID=591936 RepID=A0A8C9H2T2_9PRIM
PSCAGAEPLWPERLRTERFQAGVRERRCWATAGAARPSLRPRRLPPAVPWVSRRPSRSSRPRRGRANEINEHRHFPEGEIDILPRRRGLEAGGGGRGVTSPGKLRPQQVRAGGGDERRRALGPWALRTKLDLAARTHPQLRTRPRIIETGHYPNGVSRGPCARAASLGWLWTTLSPSCCLGSADMNPIVVVHGGGAGPISKDRKERVHQGIVRAATVGYGILREGGSAVDAVEGAVVALEDDPEFNAETWEPWVPLPWTPKGMWPTQPPQGVSLIKWSAALGTHRV